MENTLAYPFIVCHTCDDRALNSEGQRPWTAQDETTGKVVDGVFVIEDGGDGGENPVFIDGIKCWRRYRFGGWVTMRDGFDCDAIEEFYRKAFESHLDAGLRRARQRVKS